MIDGPSRGGLAASRDPAAHAFANPGVDGGEELTWRLAAETRSDFGKRLCSKAVSHRLLGLQHRGMHRADAICRPAWWGTTEDRTPAAHL